MSANISDEVRGPYRRPVNAFQAAPNSIHNDAVAQGLGLRGGTVAGSVHMDQFPPVLLDAFGPRWFETGSLSLRFVNATTDGEPVSAILGASPVGTGAQRPARMERDDGLLVAEGTASGGGSGGDSYLRAIDLRGVDPSGLRILRGLEPGTPLVEIDKTMPLADAVSRAEDGRITEPLDWYVGDSPWGRPILSPSHVVSLLYRETSLMMADRNGGAVGLFGAIEVSHLAGPVHADVEYRVRSVAVATGESPKTEFLWFDSTATLDGTDVATMRMQLRWMKASSQHYQQ